MKPRELEFAGRSEEYYQDSAIFRFIPARIASEWVAIVKNHSLALRTRIFTDSTPTWRGPTRIG
jgi:hypothetical protein